MLDHQHFSKLLCHHGKPAHTENTSLSVPSSMRPHLLQDTTLRYFLAVAQSGSLTEASARLHVAASALSRQIAGLEAQLGTPLFELSLIHI